MKQVGKRDECRKGVNVFKNTTFAKDEGSLGMCFSGNNCGVTVMCFGLKTDIRGVRYECFSFINACK